MRNAILRSDELTIRLLDAFVVFWVVVWLTIGGFSAVTLWQLAELGDTITTSGDALHTAGSALVDIGKLPVVGDRAGELGDEVVASSVDISTRGQDVKGQLHQLSLLLGFSIAIMPTTPVVGFYLPLRLARRREVKDVQRALAEHPDDPSLDRFLAARAIANMSFIELRSIADDPLLALSDRPTALADAELSRLGLSRTAR